VKIHLPVPTDFLFPLVPKETLYGIFVDDRPFLQANCPSFPPTNSVKSLQLNQHTYPIPTKKITNYPNPSLTHPPTDRKCICLGDDKHHPVLLWHFCDSGATIQKVKASHTHYRALGPKLILVYRQLAAITFRQACSYLPSRRASLLLGWYQVILLGGKGT